MSGLETAGIVLGTLPLLIAAVEKYSQGLSTLQRWRNYEAELRLLTRQLASERAKLQNVCEKLLGGLVPSSDIESMIRDPMGDFWDAPDLQKKIRFRLWRDFGIFQATVRDTNAAVARLSHRIMSQRRRRRSGLYELRRAVFTLRRLQYADLLSTIRDGISNLENLTDRNMELEPARRARIEGGLLTMFCELSEGVCCSSRLSMDCPRKHGIDLDRKDGLEGYLYAGADENFRCDGAARPLFPRGLDSQSPEKAGCTVQICTELQNQAGDMTKNEAVSTVVSVDTE